MVSVFRRHPRNAGERLKKAKNPWECLEELRRFAVQGDAAVPEEWRAISTLVGRVSPGRWPAGAEAEEA